MYTLCMGCTALSQIVCTVSKAYIMACVHNSFIFFKSALLLLISLQYQLSFAVISLGLY